MFWYFHRTEVHLMQITVLHYTQLRRPTKANILRQDNASRYVPNVSNADIKALNRLLNGARAKARQIISPLTRQIISPFKCKLSEIQLNMSGAGLAHVLRYSLKSGWWKSAPPDIAVPHEICVQHRILRQNQSPHKSEHTFLQQPKTHQRKVA